MNVYNVRSRSYEKDGKHINQNGLLKAFEEHLVSSALAPATIVNYLADLRAFLQWSELTYGANSSPLALKASDIQSYCLYLKDAKEHVPATVNRRLQALRKYYDFAGQSHQNPASDVPLLSEQASVKTRSLTAADIGRLLDAVRGTNPRRVARDRAVIQVLIGAGLKLSELSELALADAHLDANPPYLYVRGNKETQEREIPLEPEVLQALCDYLETRQASPGVDCLFVNRDGNILSTRSIQRLLRRYANAAGLQNLTSQSLRYVYATRIFRHEKDIQSVAQLLGHRHLATTIRYLRPEMTQQDKFS